ncbi:MAG TPA: MFS transporter [Terriglobales bacterium]|nr:MFS transporter [Terriglobales bacterium]
MSIATAPSVPERTGSKNKLDVAVIAAIIAGACTFLNVYCTQPLLPFLQRVYGASEVEVSLTVGAVTLAVALMAPVVGLFAESVGRKKVIVPALFALSVPTFLAATSNSLTALILWRFAQGLFVPGIITVMMAYINEEFPDRVGSVMAAYVTGTVFGGFLGRFLAGVIAAHWHWRSTFVVLGVINLLGAIAVRQWLPKAQNFVRAQGVSHSLQVAWEHLHNPRLLAVFGMGFCVLLSLVGVFTYANFYLAAPPFNLSPAALGSIFFVYLLGLIVTPLAGKFLDRRGFRNTALLALGMSVAGLLLTLVHYLPVVVAGLAFFSSGVFVSQSAATVQTGRVAGRARSSAAGLYVTFYYIGGSLGATVPAWFWQWGGWPACVALLTGVSLVTLILGIMSGRSLSIETSEVDAMTESYFD